MGLVRGAAVAMAMVAVTACAASVPPPSQTPRPTPVVAPPGTILVLPCDDTGTSSGACAEGFIIGEQFYNLTCRGVHPDAVAPQTLATGEGTYREARVISGLPPGLWLAVRGDLSCHTAPPEPLEHKWYLVQAETTQAQIQEWGEAVEDILIPDIVVP